MINETEDVGSNLIKLCYMTVYNYWKINNTNFNIVILCLFVTQKDFAGEIIISNSNNNNKRNCPDGNTLTLYTQH